MRKSFSLEKIEMNQLRHDEKQEFWKECFTFHHKRNQSHI